MTEIARLREENASLRERNEQLGRRLAEAQQAADALAGGEVDAVAVGASATPVLLQAAQENLRRSENLLRAIFDGSLDAKLLSDENGNWVDANPAACALFGLPRAELVGSGTDLAAPGYETRVVATALREDGRARGRFPLLRLDGSRRILDFTCVAHVVPGVHLSVLRDVTDNVASVEALRRSEALFRAVIEGSSEIVSLTAADGTTRYLTSVRAEEPAGTGSRAFRDQILPEDRSRMVAELDRLARSGAKELSMELRGRAHDGSTLWWELSATNLLDEPEVAAIVATQRNITARKHAEEALRESEQRYRRLIEDLPEPVLVRVDGRIVYANAASSRVFGFAAEEELHGRSISELTLPGSVPPTPKSPAAYAVGEELSERSFRRPSDGHELHAQIKSIPILYGGMSATLSIAHDITRSVDAERALAQSLADADLQRRKLEAVLAALPVGVWIADADGRLLQTNPAARSIWGGQAPLSAGVAEYAVYQAWFPDTGKLLEPEEWALARTLKTGQTVLAEALEIARFDGARGHVLLSTAPILDDRGQMVGGVVVILDVTESNRAMRERESLAVSLEHERARLGTLLEKAPAFIAVLRGEDHIFELVNESYRRLAGGRELLGRSAVEAFPELRDGITGRLDDVYRTGTARFFTALPITFIHSPGAPPERRYLDIMYQALVEVDGSTSGIFIHGVDVTEATLAQQRLRAQFHAVPVPIYVWQRVERDGKKELVLIDYNEAAMRISEGGIRDHCGESASSFHLHDPSVIEDLDRCCETGATIQREMDHVLKSTGEKKRLFVTYAWSPPDLVIVHTEDVTERTKLEHQYRQVQKMEAVGRLAGGVAHDFNNLLSVILSYSDMALRQLRREDPLYVDLQQIDEAGRRAAGLTRQLLAFSRQQVLQPRVLDLSQVITEMRSMLGRLLGEDVELVLRMDPALGRVLADPGQIEQVVMNLAVNARDAMPAGGTLTLELVNVSLAKRGDGLGPPAGDYVLLSTRDTGVGMDAETRARIFEPFFTTKSQGKGTGLGLSTVFGIVEQSHGHVSVSSEPGAGSTFSVYLPRTALAISDERSGSARPMQRGVETILVVEDEQQLRTVACVILRGNGYRVLEAANGGDALLISRDFAAKIDLLLTDVVMPRMSGRKLAEHLSSERPDMKVLFTSGYTDDAMLHHGILDEDVAFLHKPFTPEILLRKVRDVIEAGTVILV